MLPLVTRTQEITWNFDFQTGLFRAVSSVSWAHNLLDFLDERVEITTLFNTSIKLLRGGSTPNKITWVQQRQHHSARESARERMLSLALRFIPLNLWALCMLHASLLHAVDPSKFGNRLTHWPASNNKLSSARRPMLAGRSIRSTHNPS